jgi:adenine-specific DNA methylase
MNFKVNESDRKLRGGYYTPIEIARFLMRWVVEGGANSILEPSCGDGVFFTALKDASPSQVDRVDGFEIEPAEAAKSREVGKLLSGTKVNVFAADFLKWATSAITCDTHYDAVVGNPPFIRYQYLESNIQKYAKAIFDRYDLPFTKHANAWVSFVIASIGLLSPGGRLAMVVPAEILHVMHAQSLRTFVGRQCRRVLVFDPEEIWFKDTLQGAVLLLLEKKMQEGAACEGLGIVRTRGMGFLDQHPSSFITRTEFVNGPTVEGKWMRALLTRSELAVHDEICRVPEVHRFGDIASADVGIVTGANKYFLVNDKVLGQYNLDRWAHPMFGRSEHCPGVIYDEKQHAANRTKLLPSNFLWFCEESGSEYPQSVQDYFKRGVADGLDKRYKCRIREPWYRVPSVYATDVGMLKRAHDFPRLIHNQMRALTTDTAYRIRMLNGTNPVKLVFSFVNVLTALSAELEGRHYGGGVLELVPSEIERLAVPLPRKARSAIRRLDSLIRGVAPAIDVLSEQSKVVLGSIDVSRRDQHILLDSWLKLRNRRQRNPVGL